MKSFFKNYGYPVATLAGSIIGVGFLSLPYIALRVGVVAMGIYFLVLTVLMVVIHAIVGQISLKTPDFKRWPGFVGYYLGAPAKKAVTVQVVVGIFLVMLVYLVVGSSFLSAVFSPWLGQNSLVYALLYVGIAGIFIYLGVSAIARVDFLALVLLLVILLLILMKGFSHISLQNLNLWPQAGLGPTPWFLPYGALLFSLWGAGFIPEIEEMVRGRKKSLALIIGIATAACALFYAVFTFLILSLTGSNTSESALTALAGLMGNGVVSIVISMGIITTFIAFVAQGLLLKKIFMYDLKFPNFPAFTLVICIPLILFLIGFNSFIPLISFIGGVLLGIDGILILLMYRKIGGRKIIVYPLMIFFILGIVYSILYFMN